MMADVKIVKTWDELPVVVQNDGEWFSTRVLERKHRDAVKVAKSLLQFIDALPEGTASSVSMPGIDRDWVDSVLSEPM